MFFIFFLVVVSTGPFYALSPRGSDPASSPPPARTRHPAEDFVPTREKVRRSEFHPVEPWVLFTTDSTVTLWDLETRAALLETSAADLDLAAHRGAAVATLAARRGGFVGPRPEEDRERREKTGDVVAAMMVDADVAFWQVRTTQRSP